MLLKSQLSLLVVVFLVLLPAESIYSQTNLWTDIVNGSTAGEQKLPAVTFLGNSGDFVVVWQDDNDGMIKFRRFDPFGSPRDTSDISISVSDGGSSDVASVANGVFVVIWVYGG